MVTKEEIKEFYNHETYKKLSGFIYSNLRIEYAWQSLNSIFNIKTPKRILEIGSGIGEISYRLASKFNNAHVVGFDISEQSNKIANSLFVLPNLSFVRADCITEIKFSKKEKFDVIFLMDVFEHIPVEDRNDLQGFIKENISEEGFIFISCPTPQHLTYLKINKPTEIQPVDEDISLEVLIDFSKQTELKLILYKEISVWRASDYFHAIFSNQLAMQSFSDFKVEKTVQSIGLKKEILKKVKGMIKGKNPDKGASFIQIKKDLIKRNLGQEILEKVIA